MIPVQPGDHVSARHEGQILVGTVYSLDHAADTVALLTTSGVATIPAASIVAVESLAAIIRHDPHPEPFDQGTVDGFKLWELAAIAAVVVLAVVGAVAMAAAIIATGTHVYRWLT